MVWWISCKPVEFIPMRACVLRSGSKGNVTYIKVNDRHLLIDIGLSSIQVENVLEEIDIDPNLITDILITHTHIDHIRGLKTFIKYYNPTIYLTETVFKILEDSNIILNNYQIIDKKFSIDDINIKVIKNSHDIDCIGFIIEHLDNSLVYITDTGYINNKYYDILFNKNIYIFESNHDISKLLNCSRPYHNKQRVLGDKGHLSNVDSANYLVRFIGNKTKKVILAHLSEENNTKELAYNTLLNLLKESDIDFSNIEIADQQIKTEMVEV